MRPLTEVLHDGAWKGSRAFVVASGPSLKGFDFGRLEKEKTIGVNEEYIWHPTIALCQDPRIFQDGAPGRPAFHDNQSWYGGPHIPVVFQGHPDAPDWSGPESACIIRGAHSKEAPFRWPETLSEGLYYGANAGMAAISLADLLGADPIYLLGFDARADAAEAHHHDSYPKDWLMDQESREIVYGRWIKEFRKIASMVRARVINLNPDSGIRAFPRVPWQEIIPICRCCQLRSCNCGIECFERPVLE